MELVLAELCAGSRLSAEKTRFALVFHVEGLSNDRIYTLLKDFGKAVRGGFRPLLSCITPLCPMYYQDPWTDPLRLRIPDSQSNQAVISDFGSKLNELATDFDIGYHGHFFGKEGGAYTPSFLTEVVSNQFEKEHELLADLGFRPSSYAGGWWFVTPWLISKLKLMGYKIDTTLNDARKQYFGPQPFAKTLPGEPFWISEGLLEVPSVRRFGTILMDIAIKGRRRQNFAALSLHDYNLIDGVTSKSLRKVMIRAVKKQQVLSVDELVSESTKWLSARQPAS